MTQIPPLLLPQTPKGAQDKTNGAAPLSIDADPSTFSLDLTTIKPNATPIITFGWLDHSDVESVDIDMSEVERTLLVPDQEEQLFIEPQLAVEDAEIAGKNTHPEIVKKSFEQSFIPFRAGEALVAREQSTGEPPHTPKAAQILTVPADTKIEQGAKVIVPAPDGPKAGLTKAATETPQARMEATARAEILKKPTKLADRAAEPTLVTKPTNSTCESTQRAPAQASNSQQGQPQTKTLDTPPLSVNSTEKKTTPSPAEMIITAPQSETQDKGDLSRPRGISRPAEATSQALGHAAAAKPVQTSQKVFGRAPALDQTPMPSQTPNQTLTSNQAPTPSQTSAFARTQAPPFAATPVDPRAQVIRSDARVELHTTDVFGIGQERGVAQPLQTTSAPAPVALADLARQIALQLAQATPTSAPGTTEITLNPEELGRVRMSLSITDGALTLTIAADRPETTDMMRRHIDQLAQSYRQLGFADMAFNFTESSQRDHSPEASKPDPNAVDPTQQDPSAGETIQPKVQPHGRMDVRL